MTIFRFKNINLIILHDQDIIKTNIRPTITGLPKTFGILNFGRTVHLVLKLSSPLKNLGVDFDIELVLIKSQRLQLFF